MIKLDRIYKVADNKEDAYKYSSSIRNVLCDTINKNIFKGKLNFEFECLLDNMILFSRKKYTALKILPESTTTKEEQKVSH